MKPWIIIMLLTASCSKKNSPVTRSSSAINISNFQTMYTQAHGKIKFNLPDALRDNNRSFSIGKNLDATHTEELLSATSVNALVASGYVYNPDLHILEVSVQPWLQSGVLSLGETSLYIFVPPVAGSATAANYFNYTVKINNFHLFRQDLSGFSEDIQDGQYFVPSSLNSEEIKSTKYQQGYPSMSVD